MKNKKKNIEDMSKEYDIMLKQWKQMSEMIKKATDLISLYHQVFETLTQLVKNNFNIKLYYEKGKVFADVSTFKQGGNDFIKADNVGQLLINIAKNHDNYMSGGHDLLNMLLDSDPEITEEVKKAVLDGAKESFYDDIKELEDGVGK